MSWHLASQPLKLVLHTPILGEVLGSANMAAAHLSNEYQVWIATECRARHQYLHQATEVLEEGVILWVGFPHGVVHHLQALGVLLIGTLHPNLCKCLSNSGAEGKAAMAASHCRSARQAAHGISSCTAGRSWQATEHCTQIWVAGIAHPAGCRSGGSEIALHAVHPGRTARTCPGPGD